MSIRSQNCVSSRKSLASAEQALSSRREIGSISRPLLLANAHTPVKFEETPSEYHITVSLSGIDARNVYVFAMPFSVVIEIRLKNVTIHQGMQNSVTERTNQRIERELNLPAEIEQGKTKIRIDAGVFHITAQKAQHSRATEWSQLVHFESKAFRAAV